MRYRRTVLIAVLASVLIAPSLFAQTLTVKVQRGNVRSGPGKSYPVIGRVQKADNFPIEARQGDWFKILLETGREGWVFKSLVEVSGKRTIGVVPLGPTPSASRPYGDSWAIVVGINRYRKPALRLHYAVNDARSVTAALQKIGFPKRNIITLLDERATALAIRTAFNTLITRTQGQDRVFIFVAAHGLTLDRPGGGAMGYLLPVGADPANIVGTAMPMSEVKDMASLLKAKHVFFAVDACFSGLLAARSVPRAEKRVDAAYLTRGRLRQILTAGERDQPVLEEGGHGLFTRRLLEAMEGEADNSPRDGVLTAMEVAAFVQGRVIASSSSRQTPFFGTMDGVGQFAFTAPGIGNRPAVSPPPATPRPPVASIPMADPFAGLGTVVADPFAGLGRVVKDPDEFAGLGRKGTGDLFLNSKPPGAVVFLDGKRLSGPTPLLVEKVPAGEHRILVRKGEKYGGFRDVRLKAGELKNLTVSLERLKGELYVKVRPFGSAVLVDGKRLGKSPLKTKVNPGERQVEVRQEGYRRYSGRVKVEFGKTTEVSQTLAALATGTLVVSSTPSGAEIFIGKKSVGKTPRAIRLYEGEYTVRFRKPGYKPSSQKALVRGDRKSTVVAVLAVDPIPPGMVKVPAGWFIMGSGKYESEKPRRRVCLNEFFIDKYPVTNVRFRRFGKPKKDHGSKFNGTRQPVRGCDLESGTGLLRIRGQALAHGGRMGESGSWGGRPEVSLGESVGPLEGDLG